MPVFWPIFIVGLVFWLGSVIQFLIEWKRNQLITTGFYRVCLNPIYDSFIVFMIPALSLYLNSWLYLLGSVVLFFLAMKKFVRAEDDYLRATFGKTYGEYRSKVLIEFM